MRRRAFRRRAPAGPVRFLGLAALAGGLIAAGPAAAGEWKKAESGTSLTLRAVFMPDSASACAAGDKGTLLASRDGGRTWEARKSPSDGTLRGLHFTDKANGFAVGDGDSDAPPARGHVLLGPGMRMTCGSLLGTRDGGRTWTRAAWIHTNFELRSLWMVSPQSGQICNHGGGGHADGDILLTQDGTRFQQRRVYRGLNDCFWIDAKTAWAVGSRVSVGFMPTPKEETYTRKAARIVATTDGGATWSPQDSPEGGELRSVWFADRQHGVAVGDQGTIQRTTDGGIAWASVDCPVKERLNGIVFGDARRGWAVGGRGTILETADGGGQWQVSASPVTEDLLSVHAPPGGKVTLAVGAGGTILRRE